MEAGYGGNLSWAPGGANVGGDFTEKIVRQGFIRKVFGAYLRQIMPVLSSW